MNAGVVVAFLWLGPPVLPDLPAERAAKAREAEAAKREAEAAEEANEAANSADGRPADTVEAPAPTDSNHEASSSAATVQTPRRAEPSRPLTASRLRDAAPKKDVEALPSATAADVAAWSDDDALYELRGEPDALSGGSSALSGHPPTRTATRLQTTHSLENPRRPATPIRSAAFVFGYRIFQIRDAFDRPQSWHVGSLEVTPVRRWVRFNLVTEVGVEGGPAARNGDRSDLYMMEKLGLGVQAPGWLTPFVEFQGGAGVARIELFDRNDLLLIWSLGLDVGAQWAVTKWMWIHGAVGWVRPTFQSQQRAIFHDAFTFKVGLGF